MNQLDAPPSTDLKITDLLAIVATFAMAIGVAYLDLAEKHGNNSDQGWASFWAVAAAGFICMHIIRAALRTFGAPLTVMETLIVFICDGVVVVIGRFDLGDATSLDARGWPTSVAAVMMFFLIRAIIMSRRDYSQ